MKKQVFNSGLFLVLAIFFASATISVFGQSAEKEITKDYKIKDGYTLGIDNKYGEISIVNWDKNELSVVVRIESEATTQSKADALLENVNIEIDEGNSSVYFETEFDKVNMNGKSKLKVIYTVKAPAFLNVDLEQSYGSIYIQEIAGQADIEVKYGSLTASSLMNKKGESNSLELKYGEATIESASSLSAEVKYSELNVSESTDLSIESAYSKLRLGKVGVLEIESKYDKLEMVEVIGSVDVESAYTNVSLGLISKSFSLISADMTYGNLKGKLGQGVAFDIDAEASYGSINIPDGDYNRDKDGTHVSVNGKIGGASDSAIEVSLKYGNLDLE